MKADFLVFINLLLNYTNMYQFLVRINILSMAFKIVSTEIHVQ